MVGWGSVRVLVCICAHPLALYSVTLYTGDMTTRISLGPARIYEVIDTPSDYWPYGIFNLYFQRPVLDRAEAAEVREAIAARDAERAALLAEAEQGVRTYVRLGLIPAGGQSWNHRDNHSEAGVSVYAAWVAGSTVYVDLRGGVSVGVLMFSTASRYEVAGVELDEKGSDGEPLLADARVVRCIDDLDMVVIW